MKVVLVHDYLSEFGGAERVLWELSQMFEKAVIYTAFVKKDSPAQQRFEGKKIVTSWVDKVPGFSRWWYSPLRFLAPFIWQGTGKKLKDYDVVISSASWYITKGFGNRGGGKGPIEICYCHTPPRWLYGYRTSINWQRFWIVRIYGQIVGHFLRIYDFKAAQKVNWFAANSEEVRKRIKKFYRREAEVIYPPVWLPQTVKASPPIRKKDYYLTVSRIVGGKGLELAIKAAVKKGWRLKVVGVSAGVGQELKKLKKVAGNKAEFLGEVDDGQLSRLYAEAKGFLALAEQEDFGMTLVEAMLNGTGVVAFNGGGHKESVVDGKTGVLFNDYSVEGLIKAVQRFEKLKVKPQECQKQAAKFTKEQFREKIKKLVLDKVR